MEEILEFINGPNFEGSCQADGLMETEATLILEMAGRRDVLNELLSHPVHGEDAKRRLDFMDWMDEQEKDTKETK